tara:strand:- start:342 stop:986 length:645 start_codon:yes stop_codon:yes gene_type:complete
MKENLLYKKEHRFFEKMLTIELSGLTKFLLQKYEEIEKCEMLGITPLYSKENDPELFTESKSISTIKWREYNIFALYHEGLYELYLNIRELVLKACTYYNIDFKNEKFYIQGWFNVVEANIGKLDWHGHGYPGIGFHGYYCVNAEPSITYYNIFGKKKFDNININNRLIISEIGHEHKMGDWSWKDKRITVAFDILPLEQIKGKEAENHYIPLT